MNETYWYLTTIIICSKCNGKGWVWDKTGAFKDGMEPCSACEGSGRLEEVVMRKPFKGGWVDVD